MEYYLYHDSITDEDFVVYAPSRHDADEKAWIYFDDPIYIRQLEEADAEEIDAEIY